MLKNVNGDKQNVKSDIHISTKEENNGKRAAWMIFRHMLTNHF